MWVLPATAADYVFSGVNIVDLQRGEIIGNQCLVISDQRIAQLGDAGDVVAPPAAEHINSEGWFVIPGMAEMHAHVPPQRSGEAHLDSTLRLFLANGVTTMRGMLGEPSHLQLRSQLASGERIGPRLITSGPSFNGTSVETPRQAALMVRDQAAAGYDFIKLHPGLGPMEYQAITRAAAEAQLPIAGHVSVDVGLARTLRASQASIEHLDGYAQELVPEDSPLHGRDPGFFGIAIASALSADQIQTLARQTRRAGVWNVATQSLLENILGDEPLEQLVSRPEMQYIDDELRANWANSVRSLREQYSASERQKFLQMRRLLILALHEAGAGLLLGSDAPQIMNVPGFSIHDELAFLVRAGLSPSQALLTATYQPAVFFGESQQRGLLAPGYMAEVVFLRANPLQDIDHTRTISGVYHQGRWHDREQLDRWLQAIQQSLR
ncbi:MAG: amidohydrolase family protein [Wenzhouxiangellaceae bacterium]